MNTEHHLSPSPSPLPPPAALRSASRPTAAPPVVAPAELVVPETGNAQTMGYELEQLLGAGSFASAYLARHLVTGQRVALKLWHGRWARSAQLGLIQQAAAIEAAALARVRHPNLIRLIGSGQTAEGLPVLALEYVEGETLEVFLQRHSPLAPEVCAQLIRALGGALAALHRAGLVHRDVAPRNVLVRHAEDGTLEAKLIDLGSACAPGVHPPVRAAWGTPRYMAPELWSGQVSAAADVFALGAIVWWCVTGEPLALAQESPLLNEVSSLELPHMTRAPDPRAVAPSLPFGVSRWLQRVLDPDPARRLGLDEAMRRAEGVFAPSRERVRPPSRPIARRTPVRLQRAGEGFCALDGAACESCPMQPKTSECEEIYALGLRHEPLRVWLVGAPGSVTQRLVCRLRRAGALVCAQSWEESARATQPADLIVLMPTSRAQVDGWEARARAQGAELVILADASIRPDASMRPDASRRARVTWLSWPESQRAWLQLLERL